jgi:hypothetical protein
MPLLEEYEIQDQHNQNKIISLHQGDLVFMEEAVDILVISALPNNYEPIDGTLIKALTDQGISVEILSKYKTFDLREKYSCWLSQEIHLEDNRFIIHPNELKTPVILNTDAEDADLEDYDLQFKRILCFEPLAGVNPADVLEDIFMTLKIFLGSWDQEIMDKVAMPAVACGNQQFKVGDIFPNLLENAVNYMRQNIGLRKLKIVEYNDEKAERLQLLFQEFEREH